MPSKTSAPTRRHGDIEDRLTTGVKGRWLSATGELKTHPLQQKKTEMEASVSSGTEWPPVERPPAAAVGCAMRLCLGKDRFSRTEELRGDRRDQQATGCEDRHSSAQGSS